MRYYLIDELGNDEKVIELVDRHIHSDDKMEFLFTSPDSPIPVDGTRVFIRLLAGKYFISTDGKRWEKIARQNNPNSLLQINRQFQLFRGYKPSGLVKANDKALKSQMPGKVIKILVAVGDTVKEGTPLIIIEAMKMENEINSGQTGIVKTIPVKVGKNIDAGVTLMEIE